MIPASSTLSNFESAEKITIALSDLYRTMESNQTIPPLVLLQVLHQAFPRFADKVEGHYMQQVHSIGITKYNGSIEMGLLTYNNFIGF